MIELKTVQKTEEKLLFNLLQKYLYELSQFYGDDIDEEGNIEYVHFNDYFCDKTRKALLILKDKSVAGFVLINNYSYIGKKPDYVIAEFCVLPKYRKLHIAEKAFNLLCKTYPGKWELKYSVRNLPAMKLWDKVTEPLNATIYQLEDGEKVITFCTE